MASVLGLSTYTIMHMWRSSEQGISGALKRAALAYDRIFILPQGLPFFDRNLERQLIMSPFADSDSEREYLGRDLRFWDDLLLLPPDLGDEEAVYRTLWNSDDPLNLSSAAHDFVLDGLDDRYFGAPIDTRQGYKERGSLIVELVMDAYFPARLRRILGSGAAGLVTPLQVGLQQLATDHGLLRLHRMEQVTSQAWVDVAEFSWQDILDLRESPYIADFRKALSQWTTGQVDEAVEVDSLLTDGLLRFAERTRPRMRDVIVATAANFFAPLAWADTARSARSLIDIESEYGWVLFVLELQRQKRTE